MVNFVNALAYHFCLASPAAFTQPEDRLLAKPCISVRPSGFQQQASISLIESGLANGRKVSVTATKLETPIRETYHCDEGPSSAILQLSSTQPNAIMQEPEIKCSVQFRHHPSTAFLRINLTWPDRKFAYKGAPELVQSRRDFPPYP